MFATKYSPAIIGKYNPHHISANNAPTPNGDTE